MELLIFLLFAVTILHFQNWYFLVLASSCIGKHFSIFIRLLTLKGQYHEIMMDRSRSFIIVRKDFN